MSELRLEHVGYKYGNQWEGQEQYAIKDVSITLKQGEYVAIVGKTGSGKSTLIQHLNGLIKPEEGTCYFNNQDMHQKGVSLKEIRQKVALCFQYPEYQLFEENVLKDICFGPSNQGYSEEECIKKARRAMKMVGLSEDMETVSPFSLSGGQKRRVALAGIIAMEPEFLVLDEPVAGMDQKGKKNLFSMLKHLNEKNNIGIILVSHDMDDVAANAKRIIVMKEGKLVLDGETRDIFSKKETFEQQGMEVPVAVSFFHRLREYGFTPKNAEEFPMTPKELAAYIAESIQTKNIQQRIGESE